MRDTVSHTTMWLAALAIAFAVLEIGANLLGPYGIFHDELYYWVGAQRLELGYVDHPPLAPWVLAASMRLTGEGPFGFAFVPALLGASTVLLTGTMAGRFGAGRFGQVLAGVCLLVAPFPLVFFSFYSVNALEYFLWTLICFLVVELIRTDNQRLWLAIGCAAGLALLNKHTFVLLGFGLSVALIATPLRAHLRQRWLWWGVVVALLVASPNLYWNLVNDWPSWSFYRSRGGMNLPTAMGDALVLQITAMNPAAVLVWFPGLLFLLFSHSARRYRPLGIVFLTLFLAMLFSGLRRGDRIAGVYPIVVAGGAALWDRWRGQWHRSARTVLIVLLLAFGVVAMPLTLPLVSPKTVASIFEAIGDRPEVEPADVGHDIPLYLLGRLEWPRFVDDVVEALETLPDEERQRAVVLAPHWVFASVIEYYARDLNLPPVISPHNAYYFWRRHAEGRDIVLSVAIDSESLDDYFAATRLLKVFHSDHWTMWRSDLPIHVSYEPVRPIDQLLSEWRYFGLEPPLLKMERRMDDRR